MVSILYPQINLDMDGSTIDSNWYYSCLFSPKKRVDTNAILSVIGHDDCNLADGSKNHHGIVEDEKSELSIAEKDAMNEQIRLREESNYYAIIQSIESGDINSAEVYKMEVADEEAEILASMFKVLDEDGDGRVSADEMMRFLERLSLGMPKEEVELAMRSVSAFGDDFLTVMEFAEFYSILFGKEEEEAENVKVEAEQAICEAFGVFDQNGDGFISAKELADVLCILGFVEGRDVNCCQSMIESVDYNGDGFVDIHEFRQLITRTNSPTYPHLQCGAAIN